METVSVRDAEIPAIGLGTARMDGAECREAVRRALELGYRHVDTAQMYENEAAVGAGIDAAAVDRSDVFVTTKIDRGNMAYDDALSSVEASLDRLGTEYVDLLLIHSPSREVPIEETVEAMNYLRSEGAVRHVGVSNFSIEQTDAAMAASEAPIVTNQVKYHPYHRRDDLLEFCIDNGVSLTAYSPLAKGRVADDETLAEIGARYGKSGAQIALRWLIQQPNVVAIPKAADADHLRANLDVFDFALSDAEMNRIFELRGGLVERLRGLFRL